MCTGTPVPVSMSIVDPCIELEEAVLLAGGIQVNVHVVTY